MEKYNDQFPQLVKVGHTQSSCKLNIPIKVARKLGLDKAEYVLMIKCGEKKLEVKRYDSKEDYEEYVQGSTVKPYRQAG